MLTSEQLRLLRHDLLHLANISYSEVMDELLDHYASLTEKWMREDYSFDEASRKAWNELGNGRGILHIQERYKKLLLHQLQLQHWSIVRRYFRWPTLITTLLVGTLAYLTVRAWPSSILSALFFVCVFAPYLLFIPSELRLFWQKQIQKRALLTSLRREVVYRQARYGNYLYLFVIQLPILVISLFFDGTNSRTSRPYLFEWHTALSAALAFVAIMYTLTYLELYTKHSAKGFANA
ncbi:hypothetical protein GO755_37900 [Spirosoma sp. HMF4905]|uniref:Uncharacterized protein n=1 Tax=Spirosoma arboris TaxID=2682092 RepID=A0A7K1SPW3_9BACT|nr:hypothetical protein [Spirosoma arboris]MVM35852.1 hypothetical protein [Spirosoma arboris]